MKADLIVTGNIYTTDSQEHCGKMFAVKDGRYAYVGACERMGEFQDEHTKVIGVSDGLVLPGLFEGHAHITSGVPLFHGVNLYGLSSPAQYLEVVKNYIEDHPQEEFIVGRGYINGHFGQLGPTAIQLDEICSDKYIILDSEDCHSSWVNTKVLRAAGINQETMDIKNGVIVRYEGTKIPTGWLKEKEMDVVRRLLPKTTIETYKETILAYQKLAIAHGLSGIYEPVMNDKEDIEERIQAFYELDQEGKLILAYRAGITIDPGDDFTLLDRIVQWKENTNGSHFKITGIKVFLDGVIEGHTAYLREPYTDETVPGDYYMWEQENLNKLFTMAAGLDLSVHVHAIGDAAIDAALDAFEIAEQTTGKKDLRNCITHLQIMAKDQFKRFKELDIIAVVNPFWHFKNPDYYDQLELVFLGKERAEKEYPVKSFFDHGVRVTQASDWPVSYSFHPFLGLEIAVTRKEAGNPHMEALNPGEAVTVEQMLQALTCNGAYQMKLEEELGKIEEGKLANFIIIDKNILQIPKEQLSAVRVLGNYIKGEEVYHVNA